MNKNGALTKILAIVGTVLVWLPLLAPLLLGFVSLGVDGVFRFDYLMPAELFMLVLAGGAALIWASYRAQRRLVLISWSFIIGVVSLVGSQLLAVVTGLASGETAVGGWEWVLVVLLLASYSLAVFVMGIGGAFLLHDLFKPPRLRHGN